MHIQSGGTWEIRVGSVWAGVGGLPEGSATELGQQAKLEIKTERTKCCD